MNTLASVLQASLPPIINMPTTGREKAMMATGLDLSVK